MPPRRNPVAGELVHQLALLDSLRNFQTRSVEGVPPEQLTLEYFQGRLELLEHYWSIFTQRHDTLLESQAELAESEYFRQEAYYSAERYYSLAKSHFVAEIRRLTPAPAVPRNPERQNQAQAVFPAQANVWPKMSIPKFNGDQDAWESFKELFEASVTRDVTLPPVRKLQFLLGCLEGPAAGVLRGTRITAGNFEVAWEKLTRRYDNTEVRLFAHLEALIEIRQLNQKSASDLSHLIDVAEETYKGLTGLHCPVEHYDIWFVHLVVRKLDSHTRESWNVHREGNAELPTYRELIQFLEARVHSLEQTFKGRSRVTASSEAKRGHKRPAAFAAKVDQRNLTCPLCRESHGLQHCDQFRAMSTTARREQTAKWRLCFNCLQNSHLANNCPTKGRCKLCQQRHHSLLHVDRPMDRKVHGAQVMGSTAGSTLSDSESEGMDEMDKSMMASNAVLHSRSTVSTLLATAKIRLQAQDKTIVVRALVDPGAQCSFVSRRAASWLGAKISRSSTQVSGIGGQVVATALGQITANILSFYDESFNWTFTAYIMEKLTGCLPNRSSTNLDLPGLRDLKLADPEFCRSAPIDCILGADIYSVIIMTGIIPASENSPVAQETRLGWILTGPFNRVQGDEIQGFSATIQVKNLELDRLLTRFWELETIPKHGKKALSPEELRCEQHFKDTVSRDPTGRYMVRLPFKSIPNFPRARQIAMAQFNRLQKRFVANPELKKAYDEFMGEYLDLDHMELVPDSEIARDKVYYIPHHAVFKKGDPNKIRVVFNASFPNEGGLTLNQFFLAGPKLQADLRVIVIVWRFFRFVFTTDMVKFYRQFLIHPADRDWLRVLYLFEGKIRDLRLKTVTYGTAAAAFQALRAFDQALDDYEKQFPLAVAMLRRMRYVDDICGGADTIEQLQKAIREMIDFLRKIGITLAKWSTNSAQVLHGVSNNSEESKTFASDDIISSLGLHWNPKFDVYRFSHSLPQYKPGNTKRSVVSTSASFFDPEGWVTPVSIKPKMFTQQLWVAGIGWDDSLPPELELEWEEILGDMQNIDELEIPRWIGATNSSAWRLHGFGDASKRAMAACIFYVPDEGTPHLICAKSSLAPIKVLSIPKLELNAAVMLAELIQWLLPEFPTPPLATYCWSDSVNVLCQIRTLPSSLPVYESHRVGTILSSVPDVEWRYIRSADNPADCATRGLTPCQLRDFDLWWHGPSWIQTPDLWPSVPTQIPDISFVGVIELDESWIDQFSSLHRLTRVLAWCLRWLQMLSPSDTFKRAHLSATEIHNARLRLFANDQGRHFQKEIEALKSKRDLPHGSPIFKLNPRLDEGILRVGGRLQNCPVLSFNEKHPIIISKNSRLAILLIREAHLETLHGGPQIVTSHLMRKYWIVHGKALARSIIAKCPTCLRYSARPMSQQMAPLPIDRLTPSKIFDVAGVDFAGPINVTMSRHRGVKSTKGYIAVFICFTTKAIHLEVVSTLEAATFIAAFDRFISRRGPIRMVYSDNGTNFQGSRDEIGKLFAEGSLFTRTVAGTMENRGIKWTHIPPRAPHFGGLWEAAVRSFKYHLKRVMGSSVLTFEELSTLVAKIEACLNSRPICVISPHEGDSIPLTPGHFLTGTEIISRPEPFLELDLSKSFSSKWIQISAMRDHFWKQWRKDVLHQLQQRQKWNKVQRNPQVGDIVLIKDELSPPTKWPLARVEQLHPGRDNLVRVVSIRTATSSFKRSIDRLIWLPVDQDNVHIYFSLINPIS